MWGGATHLSPADDVSVRIERELDIDTEGQPSHPRCPRRSLLVRPRRHRYSCSPTAKVRSIEAALHLADRLTETGWRSSGWFLRRTFSGGNQPVDAVLGPAPAQDVAGGACCDEDVLLDLQ